MASWIYFVLISQLIWSFCSLVDKFVISKGHIRNPFVYIVINGIMNIFIIFLLPFVDFKPLSTTDFLVALLSSLALTAGIILYYKAVQYEEISRIIILYQFIPIFTLILSFFILGERLSGNDFIGFILLLAAGLLVSYRKEHRSFRIGKAFYLMMLSGFFIGIAYVTAKHVFNVTDFWSGVLWLRATDFVAIAVLLVPSIRKDFFQTFKSMKRSVKGLLGFKMLIDFSAFIISDIAILLGPVALVSALASASAPVFVFIMAVLASLYLPRLLKEDTDKAALIVKVVAIALIIIGIIFVNL
ncbi:EamA family transporter [Candidatus Woesearchaeota archaeon]|nr:EamA family transporter [Candidatus Woesearchaeota archaeon]